MKKNLAPWMLGVLFLVCCGSSVLAQDPAADTGAPPNPTVVPEPPVSSPVDSSVVSPSSGVVPSPDPPIPSATGSSTAAVPSAVPTGKNAKPTAPSPRNSDSPKETESVTPADSEPPSDGSTVKIFGLTLGIIPLIAIILGLAFIILYFVMSCVLRRRKLEMRRMRASFADMRSRLNRTMRPKTNAATRPAAVTPRKMTASTSNTPLYPENDSSSSLPQQQPQSTFGDTRYVTEPGYQRRNYQSGHVSQPPPVHQQLPQQQQAYPQPHGYPYGYGGGLPKIDGMYGVVDGYYGYSTHGDPNYQEQQPPAPNPYGHPQAYRPEPPTDGTYRINMEHMELPPPPQQHYQNDYTGVYANVNYYPEGTQFPQMSTTTQHYDPGMLRTRRTSRGARSMPYTVPHSEPPLPSAHLEEKEPRGLRAINVVSPTSTSQDAIPEMTGDDSVV